MDIWFNILRGYRFDFEFCADLCCVSKMFKSVMEKVLLDEIEVIFSFRILNKTDLGSPLQFEYKIDKFDKIEIYDNYKSPQPITVNKKNILNHESHVTIYVISENNNTFSTTIELNNKSRCDPYNNSLEISIIYDNKYNSFDIYV